MVLSIIIPSFNTKKLLSRCLDSVFETLKESTFTYEVIVVDNNSVDGTKELLNSKYARVIKIFNNKNIGYGKANNLGMRRAKGRYILLLNSDCVALENAIELLLQFAETKQRSFVGGKLLNEDFSAQTSCGPFFSLPIVFTSLFLLGDRLHISRWSPTQEKQVDWVSGACILGEKEHFLDLGGFDEEIFMYMEEIELLYRAKIKGYTTYFYPPARFIHAGAASAKNKKEPVVNIYHGLSYFYKKHETKQKQRILKTLLLLKARFAIIIGNIFGKSDLVAVYEKALATI